MMYLATIPKKINIKHWQAPVIAGVCCGLCGTMFDEILGIGTDTLMLIITSDQNTTYLIALLIGKLLLTSVCIGFGFFGGTYSPALFLGAIVGALVFQLPINSLNPDFISILAVCGMAAVSSSVIGAPVTSIILVLELTGSYEYAIAATIPIVICSFITSRVFGNSLFDKQLISRGIAITKGREQILLNEILIKDYVDNKYTKFKINTSIDEAIKKLQLHKNTEGYIISSNNQYLGKVNLLDLIKVNKREIQKCVLKKPLIIDPKTSLLEVIRNLTDFVGESIPVVDKKTNQMLGIISENDVLAAYLEISEEINQIEKY
jgi:CIC family chloride channel protein